MSLISLDPAPVVFRDVDSGEALEQVILLPRYSWNCGLSTGGGEGPGWMTHTIFAGEPLVHSSEHRLPLSRGLAAGIMFGLGWVWIGRGVDLDGTVVTAPGYRTRWYGNLWDSSRPDRPPEVRSFYWTPPRPSPGGERTVWLTKLSGEPAREEERYLRTLLQQGFTGSARDHQVWSLGEKWRVEVDWSEKDREKIRDFLLLTGTTPDSSLTGATLTPRLLPPPQ